MARIWNKHKQINPHTKIFGVGAGTPLKRKIAVAMSGGVDSSVAAKLLFDQGHEVVGIFLHFWQEEFNHLYPPLKGGLKRGYENKCCSSDARLDARRAAAKIGIRLITLNFSAIFKKQVVDNFLGEYSRGRTPNPCVRCNKLVKLGFLIQRVEKLGFDYLATGHYACVKKTRKQKNKKTIYNFNLYKAKDKNKDQSYFLYTLNQNELKHLLFPLAEYTKPEVRQMAKKFKLPMAEKPDSQEICFIAEKNHNEFLKRYLKVMPGPIKLLSDFRPLDKELVPPRSAGRDKLFIKGAIIGRHQGLPLYTIGQRKGINLGHGPFYAAKMDYKKNILYVTGAGDEKKLYSRELTAKNINWIAGEAPINANCQAVTRYRQKAVECVLHKINDHTFRVKFKEPLRAIAPGQSVVFYRGQEVLGGGIIR